MSNYFGRLYSWLTSFFPLGYEPFIGPQYLHVHYTEATYPIREGVDPCQLLNTLGSKIEYNDKVDMEELEKYIIVDNDPLKRTIASLVIRNSMSVAGNVYYRVEQGRRLVLRPVNGSGYGTPFIVTDSPTFPTSGWVIGSIGRY